MTVSTLTPASTVSSSGIAITGAASAHAALADSSDSSYVTFDASDSLELALSDLSLPAGAVITRLAAVIRDARIDPGSNLIFTVLAPSTTEVATETIVIGWISLTEHTVCAISVASYGSIADADIDDSRLRIAHNSSHTIKVAEAALSVTYVAKPVTDVTAPTGTISNTNAPTVQWSNTLDSDGGAQTQYEVKIFSAAQYGAGGFSADSSTPTETSGITASKASSWVPPDPLPDATYRVYVRVGQTVSGATHWSDWDYLGFTITANAPGVPTITRVADDDDGRIGLTVDDSLGATTHAFEIQRSIDSGATWQTIRTTNGGLITPTGGIGRAYDSEVGNGVNVIYRARALNIITAFTTYSAWTSSTTATAWQSTSWWLKSPLHPDLDMPIAIDSLPSFTRPARMGVFDILGSSRPFTVTDVRAAPRGEVRFRLDDSADQEALDDLLELGEPLLLQGAPGEHWTDRYIMLGDLTRGRAADKAFVGWSRDTLSWWEVDPPTDDVVEWPAFAS